MISFSDSDKKIVESGVNGGYWQFLFSHNVFQRCFYKVVKTLDYVVKTKGVAINLINQSDTSFLLV